MTAHRSKIPRVAEIASLAAALILVLLIIVLANRSRTGLSTGSKQVEITEQVLEGTDILLSALKGAETGQRGFLLTGEDRYLDPYLQARTIVPNALDNLARVAAATGSDQGERVNSLRPLVATKLSELADTIAIRQRHGFDAAVAIVHTDRGKLTMDRIRTICAEIRSVANQRLVLHTNDARTHAAQLGIISVFGTAALFVLLFIATVNVQRGTRRREQLIDSLDESRLQLQESRDWLRTTLTSIGDAVVTTDDFGNVTMLNDVAQSLTGWSQEDAAGKPLDRVFVIQNALTGTPAENPVARVLREGKIVGLANHTHLIARDGRRIPIDDSAAPIRRNGAICGVVLVFRDITAREEAEQAMQRSIERFRLMADHAPVLIWIADANKSLTWFNKPWLEFVGHTLEQELGNGWARNLHPDDVANSLKTYEAAFDARQPFVLEYRLRRHDGQYRWVLDRGTPLYDPGGEFTGYIGSSVDITDRKDAEQQLLRSNEDLSQFAFAASHDLQEPLRMITAYSQLLVQRYKTDADADTVRCVQFITEGTRRMRELLADLLAYTQLTADAQSIFEPVDLNSVFQKVIENCAATIAETNATVTSVPLPTIPGHEPHFVQLLQNLISNALKYRGDQPPQVHVFSERQLGFWRISVRDNGIGIAPDYHQQIFGVFKRLHGKAIPGTGIGLAICQRIVDRHGGQIWVESEAGHGATFHFTLPADPEARP
jgi:PAS domain S-box-containing protein